MSPAEPILEAMDRVKPFPQVVLKALSLLQDPDVPASKLLEVIRYDPVITMRLLQVCNSALFGFRRRVESLQQALVLLGNQGMVRLLVTFGALDLLRDPLPGYGLQREELWHHSVACATLTQSFLKQFNRPQDTMVFTGALLHDVGKILLNEYAGRKYSEIDRVMAQRNLSALEAEKEVLGIDHAELGGLLGERWNLPSNIVNMIARHHEPVHPEKDSLATCLVHLANVMCVQMGIGAGDRGLASRPAPDLLLALGWSGRTLEACVSDCWCELERIRALIGISQNGRA